MNVGPARALWNRFEVFADVLREGDAEIGYKLIRCRWNVGFCERHVISTYLRYPESLEQRAKIYANVSARHFGMEKNFHFSVFFDYDNFLRLLRIENLH